MKCHQSPTLLEIGNSPVIAKGNRQFVYEHPFDKGLLLKVPQPHTMDAGSRLVTDKWYDRLFRRATAFKGFMREFDEAFFLMIRHQESPEVMPVCRVFGTAPTDKGLALVYERISDPDGQLSPSLGQLIAEDRLTPQHLSDLNNHFDQLSDERVIISNKNTGNLVYQTWPDGSGRWVWIDSFGSKQVIPLRRWVRSYNDRKLGQVRKKFFDLIDAAKG
ncbi:YrbL family protein [Ruegeria atlantica]|uniref:PhoP regulatory network protein YrbL n=1 Tax=Ruegeria atlantica TaxID=81569 RepID=A0A0P1EQ53_9RHOB|nr:YrbL family protein [Ruegeria atlantica]CUH44590.1 PhoP regulatory network protein YrbL [Ruegeria atlantica]